MSSSTFTLPTGHGCVPHVSSGLWSPHRRTDRMQFHILLFIPKNTAGLRHKKRRKQGSNMPWKTEIYTMQVPGLLTIPHHHILDQAYSTLYTLKYGAVICKRVEPHTQLSWETCFHGLQVGHTCTRLYLILYHIISRNLQISFRKFKGCLSKCNRNWVLEQKNGYE